MPNRIDHLVIVVRNLDEASATYRELGFQVVPGGKHSGGASHNALVGFDDGAYFELYAFLDPDNQSGNHRWWTALQKGGGLSDCCLGGLGLAAETAGIRARGLNYPDPFRMGRSRPDGQYVDWQLSSAPPADIWLPFMIEDFTPRELRVPNGPEAVHPNGVTGVAELLIAVPNLVEATRTYKALLGVDHPIETDYRRELDGTTASFRCGAGKLTLAQPVGSTSPLKEHLAKRGSSPYAATLNAKGDGPTGLLDVAKAQGARLTVQRQG